MVRLGVEGVKLGFFTLSACVKTGLVRTPRASGCATDVQSRNSLGTRRFALGGEFEGETACWQASRPPHYLAESHWQRKWDAPLAHGLHL